MPCVTTSEPGDSSMQSVRIKVPAALEGVLQVFEDFPLPPTVRRLDTYLNLRTGYLATPIQSRETGCATIVEAATGDSCVACMEDALFLLGEMPTWDAHDVDDAQL